MKINQAKTDYISWYMICIPATNNFISIISIPNNINNKFSTKINNICYTFFPSIIFVKDPV